MKKLTIAAAFALAAVASQAATIRWGTNAQAYGPAVANLTVPGVYSPGTANADRMKSESTTPGVAWTYTMILSTGDDHENLVGEITTYSSNKINQNIESSLFSLPTDDSTKQYSWNIVITGTYTKDDVTYTITSDAIVGSADYTKLSSAAISTAAPTGWTVTSSGGGTVVPEPTSGLLMLLGIAGLALKRKRA